MAGSSLLDYIHPEDKALIGYFLNQPEMINEVQPLQYRVWMIDCNYLWMEATALVKKDTSSGNPIKIQSKPRNITEREKHRRLCGIGKRN
jgi:hypothetical protein